MSTNVCFAFYEAVSVCDRKGVWEREQTRKRGSVCVNAYVSDRPH